MLHTLHARKIICLVATWVWICFALTLLAAQQPDGKERLLDLSGPPPPPKGSFSSPGSRTGGIGDASLYKPEPRYPLPLELTIRSVNPSLLEPNGRLIFDLAIRNTGSAPYHLPVAINDGTVHEAGQLNRRCFIIQIRIHAGDAPPREVWGKATLGADTAPQSLWVIQPNETIVIRFFGVFSREITDEAAAHARELLLSAMCSEWTSEDDKYFIKGKSETIESKNQVSVTVSTK
jgi:hypothetical protein